jgi:hypothetical protein
MIDESEDKKAKPKRFPKRNLWTDFFVSVNNETIVSVQLCVWQHLVRSTFFSLSPLPPPHPVSILLLGSLFKGTKGNLLWSHTRTMRWRRWMSISKLVIIADIHTSWNGEKYLRLNHALQIKITILLRQCRSLFLCVSIALSMRSFYKNRHCRRAMMMIVNNIIEEGNTVRSSGKRRLKISKRESRYLFINWLSAAAVAFFWYSSENSPPIIFYCILKEERQRRAE